MSCKERLDGFTFATKSVNNAAEQNGYTPVVIYNIKGTSITQNERGDTDNRAIILSSSSASSMASLTKAPIIFYNGGVVISQENQTKELYDYYFISYSRGTDGHYSNGPTWENVYLNDYKSKRSKSLFDPCPYGFRTPTNGTYNLFPTSILAWTDFSYIGGAQWTNGKSTWLPVTGFRRVNNAGLFSYVGHAIGYRAATASSATHSYAFDFRYDNTVYLNYGWSRANGITLRCIEDCDVQSDAHEWTY